MEPHWHSGKRASFPESSGKRASFPESNDGDSESWPLNCSRSEWDRLPCRRQALEQRFTDVMVHLGLSRNDHSVQTEGPPFRSRVTVLLPAGAEYTGESRGAMGFGCKNDAESSARMSLMAVLLVERATGALLRVRAGAASTTPPYPPRLQIPLEGSVHLLSGKMVENVPAEMARECVAWASNMLGKLPRRPGGSLGVESVGAGPDPAPVEPSAEEAQDDDDEDAVKVDRCCRIRVYADDKLESEMTLRGSGHILELEQTMDFKGSTILLDRRRVPL